MSIEEYKVYMAHLDHREAEALVRITRLSPQEASVIMLVDVQGAGVKQAQDIVYAERRTVDKILARAREKIIRQTLKNGLLAGILLSPI